LHYIFSGFPFLRKKRPLPGGRGFFCGKGANAACYNPQNPNKKRESGN